MNSLSLRRQLSFLLLLGCVIGLHAQLKSGLYRAVDQGTHHVIAIHQNYLVHTVYKSDPAEFIGTKGGYFTQESDGLKVQLEFNSNFENDQLKTLSLPLEMQGDNLSLKGDNPMEFTMDDSGSQALDGHWLFGTRGPDTGQERRGDSKPRKTLKILGNGYFQWIAYQTETFKFSGTGGGKYTAQDGKYIEEIQFFSRDNSRVGAVLEFNYEIDGNDWHHKGKNSRGEPMYEIWMKRQLRLQ